MFETYETIFFISLYIFTFIIIPIRLIILIIKSFSKLVKKRRHRDSRKGYRDHRDYAVQKDSWYDDGNDDWYYDWNNHLFQEQNRLFQEQVRLFQEQVDRDNHTFQEQMDRDSHIDFNNHFGGGFDFGGGCGFGGGFDNF